MTDLGAVVFRDQCIDRVVAVEGGFSDHPADRGGPTMYGCTEAVARAYGYEGPMRELSRDRALLIYRSRYWDALNLSSVAMLSKGLAAELFDTAVNQGPGRAGEYLQRCLNGLNRRARLYPDVTVDGRIGPMTLAALAAFIKARGTSGALALTAGCNCLQGAFYIGLAEGDESQEEFLFGWLLNRVAA